MSEQNSEIVCKSNALIEASYRLSLYEQRLILTAISQVRRDQQVSDDVVYYVRAADFAAQVGIDVNGAYRQLNAAVERLFERRLTVYQNPNGKGPIKGKKGQKGKTIRWIQMMDHDAPAGMVGIRFVKDILPYLSQLSQEYTKYLLKDVGSMTSVYAIRLYELLMQWQSTGTRTVSITWLRQAFGLEDKHQAINDFKKAVIRPAVEQVNAATPLFVEWSQKKTGRRVTHLVFTFGLKTERSKQIEKAEKQAMRQAEAERQRQREAMKEKPAWVDAENPMLPNESKEDYWRRLAKIRGLETEQRDPNTIDMFFNDGESK